MCVIHTPSYKGYWALDTHRNPPLSIHHNINPAFHRSGWPPVVVVPTSPISRLRETTTKLLPPYITIIILLIITIYITHHEQRSRPIDPSARIRPTQARIVTTNSHTRQDCWRTKPRGAAISHARYSGDETRQSRTLPRVSRRLIAFAACCWEALLCAATAADGY